MGAAEDRHDEDTVAEGEDGGGGLEVTTVGRIRRMEEIGFKTKFVKHRR